MKNFAVIFFILNILSTASAQNLRIAVSANAQFVAKALFAKFEQQSKIKPEMIVSSSGKLTAQIEHGAPFDVFLSADMKYPEELYSKKLTLAKPKVYAYGVLVLWVKKSVSISSGFKVLESPLVKKIAMANPKLAPYGEAAVEVLDNLNLHERLRSKIVFGESIAQANEYLLSGSVEAVFTSKSIVLDPANKDKGNWKEIDSGLYNPIAQGAVVLNSAKGKNLANAQKFYNFLFSAAGKKIFETYGYK